MVARGTGAGTHRSTALTLLAWSAGNRWPSLANRAYTAGDNARTTACRSHTASAAPHKRPSSVSSGVVAPHGAVSTRFGSLLRASVSAEILTPSPPPPSPSDADAEATSRTLSRRMLTISTASRSRRNCSIEVVASRNGDGMVKPPVRRMRMPAQISNWASEKIYVVSLTYIKMHVCNHIAEKLTSATHTMITH